MISFHSSATKLPFVCTIHRDIHHRLYIDIDGYHFYLPGARSYLDVVEHLTILQESFERGLSLSDDITDFSE